MLSETALQPPRTKWDGPQPGLLEQSDASHRFIFSSDHGAIHEVVCYSEDGAPVCRVSYKDAVPHSVHKWTGFGFEFAGKVGAGGKILREELFDHIMVDAVGVERAIPQEKNVYITPAGFVVKLLRAAGIFWKAKAAYVGRLKNFSADHPFEYQTPSGIRTLQPQEKDILISLDGAVFIMTSGGLKTAGKLLPYAHRAQTPVKPGDFANEFIAVTRKGEEINTHVVHPNHAALFQGPLPIISGRHPFVARETPKLQHTHGAQNGEVALRNLEHAAFQLALITRAMNEAQKNAGEKYSLLVAAHSALETRTWQAASEFEQAIDAPPHSVLDVQFIRAWIDGAIKDPHAALAALIDESEMAYAH